MVNFTQIPAQTIAVLKTTEFISMCPHPIHRPSLRPSSIRNRLPRLQQHVMILRYDRGALYPQHPNPSRLCLKGSWIARS
jgi:hypothetical protein